jgi:hypothetical protein
MEEIESMNELLISIAAMAIVCRVWSRDDLFVKKKSILLATAARLKLDI